MEYERPNRKRQVVMAAGLLIGGMSLMPTAFAGCEFIFDELTKTSGYFGHPCAQPRPPKWSDQSFDMATMTWTVITPENELFQKQDPFAEPPGSNFLYPTLFENLVDANGEEMPNTLPSTPTNPYNLHDGPVLTQSIDPTNPEDDLDMIIDKIEEKAAKSHGSVNQNLIKFAIDILEGNKLKGKYYKRA